MVKPVTVFWNDLFGEFMNNRKRRATVSEKTFLEKFLINKQLQTSATIVHVRKLFRRLHDMEFSHSVSTHVDLSRINKDQFEEYLISSENDAFDPARAANIEQDMNRPLSEYFINSSHNTYLIGDQYASHSSVEMYSNALYRGARCLELDIWDGPKGSNGAPVPVVWHGGFMTTKVRFTDIIKTIKVFLNFHPDTYPIILSFENHCSIPYQKFMAQKLLSILGDSLYIPTEASLFGELPSPLKLRGMVVIKGRRPDGTEADQYDTDDDSDTEEGTGSSYGDLHVAELTPVEAQRLRESLAARQKVVKHGVAPELASLTLLHGHKWKSFETSASTPKYFMVSLRLFSFLS
jgi:Phosphatidylinositol-specific phospholipase C, X domain